MQGYRATQEDCCAISAKLSEKHGHTTFAAVYDGHAGGGAAEFALDNLGKNLGICENPMSKDAIVSSIYKTDDDYRQSSTPPPESGTTVVMALVERDSDGQYRAVVAHVGDSRAVFISHDGKSLRGLTVDHKPSDLEEQERIVAAGGRVVNEEFSNGRVIPRVDGELACSRAIGDFSYKSNKALGSDKQKVVCTPSLVELKMQRGDMVVFHCNVC